jgi:hypothetical protein
MRMLGDSTSVRPPSIPSHLHMPAASQRQEERGIERTVSTSSNNEEHDIDMRATRSKNKRTASRPARKNRRLPITHKPSAEEDTLLAENEQTSRENDNLQSLEIDGKKSHEKDENKNCKREEADETTLHIHTTDQSFFNVGKEAQEKEESDNNNPDSLEARVAEIVASVARNSDVVLSLNDQYYKEVMWLYYKELGRNRDSIKEAASADQVFRLFKEHMGNGKFFKLTPFGEKIQVDEKLAYDKIIADVRRRLVSYKHWSTGMGGAEKKKSSPSPVIRKKRERPIEKGSPENMIASESPRRSTRTRNPPDNQPEQKLIRTNNYGCGPGENDIILSLNDERYREVMWKHFRLLGAKTPGDNSREEEIGSRLFQWFKTGLRQGGHFYKKEPRGDEIFLVDDEMALRKIIRDLKRRMESSHKWYNHENSSAEMEKLLGGLDECSDSIPVWNNSTQTNVFTATSSTSLLASIHVQNSLSELLESSHLGKRIPSINNLSSVRAIQTPNELIQTLLLATHKLNELSGTSSKHRKQLRLYELREFSTTCGLAPCVHKDIPSLAELAEYMETTPKSLRKWFRMYKKALTRRFDFKTFGDDKIRDHYDIFFGSDRFRISEDAVVAIEQFFEETGKRIMRDFENNNVLEPILEKCTGLEKTSDGVNIFHRSPTVQIGGEGQSRKSNKRTTEEDDTRPCADGETVFQRHFQRNHSRLQAIPNCPIKLCTKVKRVEKGQKIRTICMVIGCEKQAQTKCDGCCTTHHRALSSVSNDRKVGHESVVTKSVANMEEERIETPASPSSDSRGKKEQDVEEMDIDKLQTGSRIYVEWKGDDTLYKATVKKVMLDKKEPAVKIHYDGKKRHILDTVPLNMVKGFITGENDRMIEIKKRQLDPTLYETEQNDSIAANNIDNGHLRKKSRLNLLDDDGGGGDDDDAEVTYINFNNFSSEPKQPHSPMTRFSPISRNRDTARSTVLISPISTKPFVTSPNKLQHQQLPTSAFIGIRSVQKPSAVAGSRIGLDGVRDTAKVLFAPEQMVEMNVKISQSQPMPKSMFKCHMCSADCMYDSRMCSVCFMKSYYVSGQGSTVYQERNGAYEQQQKRPSRDIVNQQRFQETSKKQKPLQSKPVVCHCPDCEKGDFTIQGMYAHWGRAHNDRKLPWHRVIYSCPFCHSQRKYNTLAAIESHTNSVHSRCELLTPNTPKQSRSSGSASSPNPNDRSLRDRKIIAQPSTFTAVETSEVYKPPPPEPLRFKKLEYAQLLPDGKKEYPRDLSKVIEMIEEQCKSQEEVVNAALDQRTKLCKSEADSEAKERKEERLAYQRGIRERTRMADQERIEKHRFSERHEELIMRYEYENRNKKTRDKEEIELNRLCSNPIIIATSKMRHGPDNRVVCNDEECQFCKEDSSYREHLLLDNEVPDFKLDFASEEAFDLQQRVKVLNPTVRTVIDSDFFDADDDSSASDGVDDGETTTSTTTNGKKRLNSSRRVASMTNRLRTEEEKLLDLQYSKHNFEFIFKYNQGLIRNAWGEKKDTRGRKPINYP